MTRVLGGEGDCWTGTALVKRRMIPNVRTVREVKDILVVEGDESRRQYKADPCVCG